MSSRVPVRRRDDAAAGRDRERQRAGGDLLAVAVRRHEHVGRGEQVGELVDREEAVVELDVLAEIELEHAPLEHQAVPLAFAVRDVRMRAARRSRRGPRGAARSIAGSASITVSSPLPGRDQPERREQEAVARARVRRRDVGAVDALAARARSRRDGAPCGTTRTFSSGQAPHSTSSRRAVSVMTITQLRLLAELREHLELVRRRLGEHRVQRDDERLRQLLGERQHVLAVARRRRCRTRAGGARRRRRAGRACARRGRSRRGPPARSSRAAPRRCGRDGSFTTATTSTRSMSSTPSSVASQVGREGADAAGARRKGGDDRCAH